MITPGFEARLVRGNCSSAGFGDFKGNDPVFRKVGLWFRTKEGARPPKSYVCQVRKTPSWPRSWANFSLL